MRYFVTKRIRLQLLSSRFDIQPVVVNVNDLTVNLTVFSFTFLALLLFFKFVPSSSVEDVYIETTVISNSKLELEIQFMRQYNKPIKEFTDLERLEYTQNLAALWRSQTAFSDKKANFFDIKPNGFDVIQTCIMESLKYNIPTSIKLAQAILETGWGTRVIHYNYYGIKDAQNKAETTTTEYLTRQELIFFKGRILSKTWIESEKKFKCVVVDSFKKYESEWSSFRDHSLHITHNPRYASLIFSRSNYKEWAVLLHQLGYATDVHYADKLIRVIEQNKLYLLD